MPECNDSLFVHPSMTLVTDEQSQHYSKTIEYECFESLKRGVLSLNVQVFQFYR